MQAISRRNGAIALTLSASLLCAGCSNEAGTGALIGAGVGALAGQLLGGDTESTAIGAGIGALIGGAIGTVVMVQRAQELEEQLARTGGGQVEHLGESRGEEAEPYDVIVASMSEEGGRVLFEHGQDKLAAGMTRQLDPVVAFLKKHNDLHVAVVGHTDSTVPAQSQVDLSQRRADYVARHLLSKGIQAERIVTRGAGAYAPIASNETLAGRARNRRVDMVFYQEDEQPPEIRVALAEPVASPTASRRAAVNTEPTRAPSPTTTPVPPTEEAPTSAIRPAHELARIYTGTDEGRAEARSQQSQASTATSSPPISPVRPASELLD